LRVTEIGILRDGGTITFRVLDDPALDGHYRLQTPFLGEPRPIFRDEKKLELGSAGETALATALERWLDAELTPERSSALAELDRLSAWKDLPQRLVEVVPFHRVRTVIRCLEARRRS